MKRWINLTARVGMMLIVISLALFIVSLMPQSEQYKEPPTQEMILPQTYSIIFSSQYATPLSPQMGIHIILVTNGTLNLKLFNSHWNYTFSWVPIRGNINQLEEYAASHPANLTLEQNIPSGNTTFEYVPSKIEGATMIVSNPTSSAVQLRYENITFNVIASSDRVFLALVITAPLGIALTVPRIVSTFIERRRTKKQPPKA